jgi:Rhodanese-related sulfurtransferase
MPQLTEFVLHHIPLFAAFGFVLLLLAANELHGMRSAGPRVNAVDAVRLINDRNALVVDVRPAGDFRKAHLVNAVNLPLAQLRQQIQVLAKERERPVIIYCGFGNSSMEGARVLRQNGFGEVYSLRGGLSGWMSNNLPVTSK